MEYTEQELGAALIKAHKAGDTESARALVKAIDGIRAAAPSAVPMGEGAIMPDMPYDPRMQETNPKIAGKFARDVGRSLLDIPTIGTSDEIRAAFSSATSGQAGESKSGPGMMALAPETAPSYDTALGQARARDRDIDPAAHVVANLAALPAAAPAVLRRLPGLAIRGTGGLANYGRALLGGTTYGGLLGFNTGEGGFNERAGSATTGAKIGALVPGVAYPAMAAVPAAMRTVHDIRRAYNDPKGRALTEIAKRYKLDEVNMAQAPGQLGELGKEGRLLDIGDMETWSLARGVAGQPGQRKKMIRPLEQRRLDESERIEKLLSKKVATPVDEAFRDEAVSRLMEGARDAYTPAYRAHQNIGTPGLSNLVKGSPNLRRAVREAHELAVEEAAAGGTYWVSPIADELDDFIKGNFSGRGMSLEAWDYVKRQGVDSLLEGDKLINEFTGKYTKKGQVVAKVKRRLVDELDRATGGADSPYAAARKKYGDEASIVSAMDQGRHAFKSTMTGADVIKKQLSGMSEAERDAYQMGAVRSLIDKVTGPKDTTSAASSIIGSRASRKKLRELFPTQASFEKIRRRLEGEMAMTESANAVGQGSRTAPMLADIADAKDKLGSLGAIIASNSPFGHALVASKIGRNIVESSIQPTTEMNTWVRKILMTKNRAQQLEYIRQMAPQMRERVISHPAIQATVFGTIQQQADAEE